MPSRCECTRGNRSYPSRVPQPDDSVDTGTEVSAFGYLLDYRAGVRKSLGTSSGIWLQRRPVANPAAAAKEDAPASHIPSSPTVTTYRIYLTGSKLPSRRQTVICSSLRKPMVRSLANPRRLCHSTEAELEGSDHALFPIAACNLGEPTQALPGSGTFRLFVPLRRKLNNSPQPTGPHSSLSMISLPRSLCPSSSVSRFKWPILKAMAMSLSKEMSLARIRAIQRVLSAITLTLLSGASCGTVICRSFSVCLNGSD
jgi:hypothetical protein